MKRIESIEKMIEKKMRKGLIWSKNLEEKKNEEKDMRKEKEKKEMSERKEGDNEKRSLRKEDIRM